jgi:hypothetical protein
LQRSRNQPKAEEEAGEEVEHQPKLKKLLKKSRMGLEEEEGGHDPAEISIIIADNTGPVKFWISSCGGGTAGRYGYEGDNCGWEPLKLPRLSLQ